MRLDRHRNRIRIRNERCPSLFLFFVRRRLSAIRCRTTVIVGEGDELTPPEMAREIASGIPGAELIELADCGHLATLECPVESTAALLAALSS